MATILCLETSTKVCSVALGVDGNCVASKEVHKDRFTHSENLNLFVEDVLTEAGLNFEKIDAIAVSEGPGSYTGLRIGVSTAKGYCYSHGAKLIAVSTLKAMANGVSNKECDFIIPMLDARRMEVFSAVFSRELTELEPVNAVELDEYSYNNFLDQGKVALVGDGAEKYLSAYPNENVVDLRLMPSARFMVQLAEEKFHAENFADVAYFEPFYLKDFVAGKPKKLF